MSLSKFLQKKPVISATDTISHVRNLMNRYLVPEIPVMDETTLLGTITSKAVTDVMKKVEIENLIASHLLDRGFIRADVNMGLSDLVGNFLRSGRHVACIFKGEKFLGFIQRRRLLELLIGSKDRIKNFMAKNFVSIESDKNVKKLLKLLERNLPIMVLKDGLPWTAFTVEELYSMTFISDYARKKYDRDFETLRGKNRRFLKSRIDQQLLSHLKETATAPYLPQLRIEDIADRQFVLTEDGSVGEAAKMMLDFNRAALAVKEGGMVTDLSLLEVLK